MRKQPKDAERQGARSSSSTGSMPTAMRRPQTLHYVPLPATLVQQVEAYWATELK
jgi:phosphate transport system substrate-binding protein